MLRIIEFLRCSKLWGRQLLQGCGVVHLRLNSKWLLKYTKRHCLWIVMSYLNLINHRDLSCQQKHLQTEKHICFKQLEQMEQRWWFAIKQIWVVWICSTVADKIVSEHKGVYFPVRQTGTRQRCWKEGLLRQRCVANLPSLNSAHPCRSINSRFRSQIANCTSAIKGGDNSGFLFCNHSHFTTQTHQQCFHHCSLAN